MKNRILFCCLILVLSNCNKKKFFAGPSAYQDNFENYSTLTQLLLPADDALWSFTQITREGNWISIDSTKAHTGSKSLKFDAKISVEGELSKCSIAKQNMSFWDGETMRVSAWYFIEGTSSLEWMFLFDLEEQTPIGAGPGMRLALVNNRLRVEYKFNEKDIVQTLGEEVDFPRNQWVEIVWEVKLSQKHKGSVKLWQNGIKLLDTKNNRTLPKDLLYFQQGTKGMYSSIEVGVTANSYDNPIVLWIDDIKFEKVN